MAYTPPDGGNIVTNLSGAYTPPDGGNIVTGGLPPVVIVPESSPTVVVPWRQTPPVERAAGAGWRELRSVEASVGIGWAVQRLLVQAGVSVGWKTNAAIATTVAAPWQEPDDLRGQSVSMPSRVLDSVEQRRAIPWDENTAISRGVEVPFLSPPPKSRLLHIRNGQLDRLESWKVVPWTNPPAKCIPHISRWGIKYYLEICWRTYEPPAGDNIVTNMVTPIGHVDDGDHITTYFDKFTYDRRCTWREHSGQRDAYFYIPPAAIPAGLDARVYVMLNTAALTRLPDRAPIDVSSITVSTDWDSVYWSVKASVGSDAHLAMLEATEDGPILIETAINGHLWNLQVDSWGTDRAFGSKTRSISGRSFSAQLGAPAAELRTRTETEQRYASQLMNAELENTGWTAVIAGDDWLVPANVFSYADQTPMQIIKQVADAVRAMVYTDPLTKTITVKPRYRVPPWQWASTAADIIIPSSMADKVDGEWDERPFYNAAFVSGEAGGISAKILRAGSAGDLVAPMITDKLMTATEAVRARGIAILSASGKWSRYRLSLPVFPPPGIPGVILPGTLLQFVDGASSWKGVVSSVSVAAPRVAGVLKVRQALDVERYHGN